MEKQVLNIQPIVLEWSHWIGWDTLKVDARSGGVKIPNGRPGVYEVKYDDTEERLTIGKAANLRMRIRQGLVKGKTKHSAGKSIRANENLSRLVVRWAETDRPAAAEEELHIRYVAKFGTLPRYVQHT